MSMSKADRRSFLQTATAAGLSAAAGFALARDEAPAAANMGLLIYSYGRRAAVEKEKGFSDPGRFIEFAKDRGANAVQVPLGSRTEPAAASIRKASDKHGVIVEGIVSPPKADKADRERFANELTTARNAGASVVRMVLLGGRRYEVFEKEQEFTDFAKRAEDTLRTAEPIAQAQKVILAVENHKDFRTEEQVALLKKFGSDWLGVCLDTGNNLALLENPTHTVESLAPLTRTVHLKDIGVEESTDGFCMAEVPLGQGILDLKSMIATVRKASPNVRFHLEMITRDPLEIPCLGEKYWATFAKVNGRDLAQTLRLVKANAKKKPLLRIAGLTPEDQVTTEDRHVRESFVYASKYRLIPT